MSGHFWVLVAVVLSGSRGASLKFQLIPVGGFPAFAGSPPTTGNPGYVPPGFPRFEL
ncbi:twin arginine-targeting protein translocase [Mobiluncus mulieris]|nr:twin arginine-targeting protein translocase [Mobiluncus mulieris]